MASLESYTSRRFTKLGAYEMTDSAEEPKTLYHYTTQSGLLGIVRERAVWATNIGYLNDSREYRCAVGLFSEPLESSGIDLTLVPEFQAFSKESKLFDTFSFPLIFVFSMSEHDDGLDLWRAYSKGDSGYAIGLPTNELTEIANKQGFELVKCSYDIADHDNLIRQFTDELRVWCEKELTKQPASPVQQRFKFHMYFYPKFGVLAA
jgi:hypothetical protein